MSLTAPERDTRRIVRHTVLNLLGQGAPALVGLLTVPIMVRGLGTEAFGAFSLAWVILGYFSLIDLGLGRATTHSVAAAIGHGLSGSLRSVVWSSVRLQAALGLCGAVILAAFVPWMVEHAFQVPAGLRPLITDGLFLLAASLPVLLLSACFSGVLEAMRRFEVLNAIRIPAGIAVLTFPAIAVLMGWGFLGAILALVSARLLGTLALAIVVGRLLPPAAVGPGRQWSQLTPRLLSFGSWITVSNVVSPLMVYSDRLVIGSQLGLLAVAHYTAPFDVVSRLSIIPSSLVSVLFPEFARLRATDDKGGIELLLIRSSRALVGILGLVVVLLIPLTRPALTLWLGADFAIAGTWATRILLLGVFVNSLAWVPLAYLQGSGRPDLTARAHLIELPIYLGVLWAFTAAWGITGTALAWLFRVTMDSCFLFYLAARTGGTRGPQTIRALGPGLLIVGVALSVGSIIGPAHPGLAAAGIHSAVAAALFLGGAYCLLDDSERTQLSRLVRHLGLAANRTP